MKKSERTKKAILDKGVELWPKVTARGIARELEMTHSIVIFYFGDQLENEIAKYAVEKGNSRVIAQLIAVKHKAVRKMTDAERLRHMRAAS